MNNSKLKTQKAKPQFKIFKFLTFAFLLLPFALSACGGGSSSSGGKGDATNLTGTVYAPNGSDPVAGATIYIPSGSASISAKGKTLFFSKTTTGADGTTCADPAETSCASTCSGSNGSFTMDVTACSTSDSTMKIVKGSLSATTTLDCGSDATCTLAATATTFPSSGSTIPTMAVVTGSWDNMQDVLAKLGFGSLDSSGHLDTTKTYNFTLIDGNGTLDDTTYKNWDAYLDGTEAMSNFNIIFINCSSTDSTRLTSSAVRTRISDFVNNGGKLYVTDLAYDHIEQPIPQFLKYRDDPDDPNTPGSVGDADHGKSGITTNASIGNTTMKDWLKNVTVIQASSGSGPGNPYTDCSGTYTTRTSALNSDDSIPIGDFLSGWAEIDSKHTGTGALDPTLWITGTVEETDSSTTSRPLTASVAYGSSGGKIAYSSYHTAHSCPTQYFWPQERVLEYLVLETF